MKQLIFMIVMTLAGTFGVVYRPFWGVAVYYLFATLRPQFLWEWVLPKDVQWSRFVSLATIAAALAVSTGHHSRRYRRGSKEFGARFGRSQILIALFALWICGHLCHGKKSGRCVLNTSLNTSRSSR